MADRVVVDGQAVAALSTSDEMRDVLMDLADPIEEQMRVGAPKRSGEGAASIRSEPMRDEFGNWTVRISWTRDRFYMYFHDRGTVHLTAQNFVDQAIERATVR